MTKFNSLGSNYEFKSAMQALFLSKLPKRTELKQQIKRELSQQIGIAEKEFTVEYFYKGREALWAALADLNLPKNSLVAITGFTCLAVYEAVLDAGLKPILIDVDENLNLNLKQLLALENKNIKVVIIQNTFGFTQKDIKKLQLWCKQNKISLLEDGAHCFGATYQTGQKVGAVGDYSIFSSSQDKILDSVSGGFLIKKGPMNQKIQKYPVTINQQNKDRIYPMLTWLIRHSYGIKLGQVLHFFAKKIQILSQPMTYQKSGLSQTLPTWQMGQLLRSIQKAPSSIKHRQEIAKEYDQSLSSNAKFFLMSNDEIINSAALRFPVKVPSEKRLLILNQLAQKGYQLCDFWYDSPVGPVKYVKQKKYLIETKILQKSNEVAHEIINLPTHQEITRKDVRVISELINKTWNEYFDGNKREV